MEVLNKHHSIIGVILLVFSSQNVPAQETANDFEHQSWRALGPEVKALTVPRTAPVVWNSPVIQMPAESDFEAEKQYLLEASVKQRDLCAGQDLKAKWSFGSVQTTRQVWCLDVANRLIELTENSTSIKDLYSKVLSQFHWGQSQGRDGRGEVHYTGYYSPFERVSRFKSAEYSYPLYAKPNDLVRVRLEGRLQWRRRAADGTLSLYSPRAEIQAGSLAGQNLEIAYFKTLLDTHIYEVQGSGLLEWVDPLTNLPTGEKIWAQYAGQNGWGYRSVGSIIRDAGEPRDFWESLFGLRRFFANFPDRAANLLAENPSYVFFQLGHTGPMGASGLAVTTGHSLAADPAYYPFGTLMWAQAERFDRWDPMTGQAILKTFSRLAWVQDTGGAIKGAGRFDYYWGSSETSEARAGTMNSIGKIFVALPR